jgi:hypothetical protein
MKILRFYHADSGDIESIPCSRINSLLYTTNSGCISLLDKNCGDILLELTAKEGEDEVLKKLEKDLVKFLADENTNKNIFNLSITLDEDEYVKELSWEIISIL